MNDNYEMFVKGRKNRSMPLIYIGVFVLCIVIALAVVAFIGPMGILLSLLIALGGAYICMKINGLFRVEYEYSLMAGQLSFSIIRNQTIRKTLAVCDVKEIGSFGQVSLHDAFEACREKIVGGENRLCCVGDDAENVFFIVARSNDGKTYRIYFAPDEKMLGFLEKQSVEIKRWGMKNGGFGA